MIYSTGAEALQKMPLFNLMAAFMFLGGGYVPDEPGPYPDIPTIRCWYNKVGEELDNRYRVDSRDWFKNGETPPRKEEESSNELFVETVAPLSATLSPKQ